MSLIRVLFPLLTVGSALAAVLAFRQARQSGARLRRAQPAQGVVVDVDYNASLQVFPTVQFSTADGRTVQAKPQSSTNTRRFVAGQPVGLRYDPEDPRWMVVDGLPSASGITYLAAVGLALASVVLATAWWFFG